MNRRYVLRAVAVLLLVGGTALVVPSPGRAATIESGWWWRANTGSTVHQPPAPPVALPGEPPAPPTPPNAAGGLQVAATLDGAFAVAAVRVDQELTSITLRVAPNGDANGTNAELAACAAMSQWEPAHGGRWDAKPVVACDLTNGGGSVAGIRSDDGSNWTFPVAPLADDGKTDVVIVPLATNAGLAVPFQLVFAPPTEADLVVSPVVLEESRGSDEAAFTDDATFTGNDFSGGSEFSSFDSTFDGGATGGVSGPVVSPALGANEQAPTLPAFARAPVRDNGSQLVGAAMVVLALGLFYWASRQATPPIHPLVGGHVGRPIPVSEPQMGGLGRFARVRVGKPPALQ